MANEQNLRPGAHKFTQEEASKGGQNSAKARKEKKMMQQRAKALLEMALHKGKRTDIDSVSSLDELSGVTVKKYAFYGRRMDKYESYSAREKFLREFVEQFEKRSFDGSAGHRRHLELGFELV